MKKTNEENENMMHILPINDEREHEEATTCWCEPELITDLPELLVVHNAADCRELIEEAERIATPNDWMVNTSVVFVSIVIGDIFGGFLT